MKKLDYIELGATLFVPASHKSLNAIVNECKYPELKSLVIDSEDGLNERDFEDAKLNIQHILKNIKIGETPFVFLRPRNIEHLKELLRFESIEKVTGFVCPKFSLSNAKEYLYALKDTKHYIMPSIEGKELFNHSELLKLRDILLTNKHKIVLVRFGLEDMLRQLKMRRKCDESIFDFSATNYVLGNFIATFKSAGFGISGGVYPCFKDEKGFIEDIKRDLKEGLFSKTIIHPNQIELAHNEYKVSQIELNEALEICNSTDVVFEQNSKMAECSTMYAHSKDILTRAKIYGVK